MDGLDAPANSDSSLLSAQIIQREKSNKAFIVSSGSQQKCGCIPKVAQTAKSPDAAVNAGSRLLSTQKAHRKKTNKLLLSFVELAASKQKPVCPNMSQVVIQRSMVVKCTCITANVLTT